MPVPENFHELSTSSAGGTSERYRFRGPLLAGAAGAAGAWRRVDSPGSAGGKCGASEQNGQTAEVGAEGAADQW